MQYPGWWAADVRVIDRTAQTGVISALGDGAWIVSMDGMERYIVNPDPANWQPEVRQLLTAPQRDRVVHDAERALLRAFGCHYIPEFEGLPESVRTGGLAPHPRAVGRPELDGLQAVIRGALVTALGPYTREQ